MSNPDQASAPAGGFGKMLNSLQGLQQRLEDFSITDVANAEANAQTLILRLRQFQDTIAALARLKSAAADIDRSIAEIPPLDNAVVDLDNLENHPQLHAIVKVSKLIKLQKLMTALKAGADEGESIAVETRVAVSEISPTIEPTEARPAEFSDKAGPDQSIPTFAANSGMVDESTPASLASESDAPTLSPTAPAADLELTVEPPTLTAAAPDAIPVEMSATTDFPTAQAEFETAVAAVVETSSAKAETRLEDFPAPVQPSTVSSLAENLPAVEATAKPPISTKPKHGAKAAAKKQQKSRENTASLLDESKALVPANESFDLRLLDDLVSNYGEFAANPNLPATIQKKEVENFQAPPTSAQQIQPEQFHTAETATPVIKNHVDFDRQLKKIIKDYGEYDLYSDKPTTNIKKAGIIAFVFLGLVFGGIYFFTAPPSTAKTAPASAQSAGGTAQTGGRDQPGAEANHGDTRKGAAGNSQNVEKANAKNK